VRHVRPKFSITHRPKLGTEPHAVDFTASRMSLEGSKKQYYVGVLEQEVSRAYAIGGHVD
jgi:hypothetical protein